MRGGSSREKYGNNANSVGSGLISNGSLSICQNVTTHYFVDAVGNICPFTNKKSIVNSMLNRPIWDKRFASKMVNPLSSIERNGHLLPL